MRILNPFKIFVRPEYFFTPRQILVRLQATVQKPPAARSQVQLPWGERLWV